MIPKLFLLILLHFNEKSHSIKTINSCKCELENGTFIDISALANSDGTPKFKDIPDKAGKGLYSYNPCTGFTEGTCDNVAVCQQTGSTYSSLGNQNTAQCLIDQNGPLIQFSADDSYKKENFATRTAVVYMICDTSKDAELQVPGEVYPGTFLMFLVGQQSCLVDTDKTTSSNQFSTGTYISIGFGGLLVLYLIVGMLYKCVIKNSSGKDVIPNINTWSSLAGLIKDGIVLVACWPWRKGYSRSL